MGEDLAEQDHLVRGFDTMQYYATVSEEGSDLDNIMQLEGESI